MRRKGVLDRLHLQRHAPTSSSSVNELDDPTSADNSQAHHIISSIAEDEGVPPWKLVPLPRHPVYPHHAVGIDDEVNSIIQLLEWENEETNLSVAVILHGLGGTGKTTLADAVVATLADFQGWTFSTVVSVPDASGVEHRHAGLDQIQAEKQGAFIYMDNFTVPSEHLHKLLPNNSKKLRLLVTARDEMVADVISGCGIRTLHLYSVGSFLSEDACMELLCKKMGVAAATMQIPHHHMSQINEIIKICDGVPLVLERVGAYICQSRDKDEAYKRVIEWSKDGNPYSSAEEYCIEKKGLLFDLDELPASAKEPFLDICSFFNGWDWDQVSCIMGEDMLSRLRKRALLLKKEDCENKVTVRPIILTIGRIMTKGKRFTSVHDLNKVLEGNDLDDIRGIKGIWLQNNISQPFLLSAKTLDLMHGSLRVLALGDMVIVVDGQCTQKFKQIVYFQAGLIPYIPFHPATSQELRFLDWLPHSNDDLQLARMSSKLKVLILNGGRYDRRFETASVFERLRGLKTLKLAEFKTLKILPEEISLLIQLEELDLCRCRKLVQLPKSLGNLKALAQLSLRDCWSLEQLPDSFGKLRSLKYLDLHSCGTLKQLPEALGNLKALVKLSLQSCESLQQLPDSFGKLRSLKYLNLRACDCLKQLPEDFGSLSSLEELDLGELIHLEKLPSSFEKLSSLKVLNMKDCKSDLNHLPDNITNLSVFFRIEVEGSRIVRLPSNFQVLKYSFPVLVSMFDCSDLPEEFCSYLKLVKDLSFGNCELLSSLPNQLVDLDSLTRLDLNCCRSLEMLPQGFGQLKSLAELNLNGCYLLQHLSTDFHCLASLQSLYMQRCEKLQGKWMDSVVKIKTLEMVDVVGSKMLVNRWAEMEKEKGQQSGHFILRTGHKKWKNVENHVLNKASSKLLSGDEYLLTDSRGEPFSLSAVEPDSLLLVMYDGMYDENYKDSWAGRWRLVEEVVKHEHHDMPFKMIYVGKYFGQLSKCFADRIIACASFESEASLLLCKVLQFTSGSDVYLPTFLLTEVVLDGGGRKHFSAWKNTGYLDDLFLSKSTLFADLQKLRTEPPVHESDVVMLLRALFADVAESTTSSIFVRNYTENIGLDQLHGKTVLLLISVMDEHPFGSLTEIYSRVKSSDKLEIISIPIPAQVHRQPRWQRGKVELPDSDLAGFESILRNVAWPVLRNPWLLKTLVYNFIEREWGILNPGILVVVEPNGRICNKNALPLVETWGSQVLPFSEEKMKQLEQESREEHLSEYILNGLFEKWSN